MGILRIQRMKVSKGITLIELLIVIIVVGLLASIAIPMYTNYTTRARRADAKTALEQLRAAQEMRRAEKGSYITDLVALRTTWGGPGATSGDYNITIAGTATTFTGTAAPFRARQVGDGSLFIDHLGQKWDSDGKFYPEGKWAK
jgi:prepilin-type N-terminal cleavage/methylation domain-containing protein